MSSITIVTDTDSSLPGEVAACYGIRHYCGTGGRCPSPSILGRRPWKPWPRSRNGRAVSKAVQPDGLRKREQSDYLDHFAVQAPACLMRRAT